MEDWGAGMQENVFEEFGFGMEALVDNLKHPFTEQLCIKGDPDFSLEHCIQKSSISLQDAIAKEYDFELVKGKNRRKQLKQLKEKILEGMSDRLAEAPSEELKLFMKMAARDWEMEEAAYSIFFAKYGWIFYFIDYKDDINPVVPDEVVVRLRELPGDKDFERKLVYCHMYRDYLKIFLKLYGVFEKQWLFQEIERHYYAETDETEMPSVSNDDILLKLQEELDNFEIEDSYIFDPDLAEDEDYKTLFNDVRDKTFYPPSEEEAEFYCENYIDERLKEYLAVKRYLKEKVSDRQEIEGLMMEISVEAVEELGGMYSIPEIVDRYKVSFSSEEDLKEFERLFRDLEDHLRKWNNRGYTNLELGERGEEGSRAVINWDFDRIRLGNDTYPDAPCPCGSGKKYKQCCGRAKR